MSQQEPTMTAKQAAERLRVSHSQLTRYVADGRLQATWHGNSLVIREADVARFVRPLRGNPNFLKKTR